MSSLPKDVDEFIEARYCMFSTTAEKFISETDLRTFLAQYVLCDARPAAHVSADLVRGRCIGAMAYRDVGVDTVPLYAATAPQDQGPDQGGEG